MAATFIAIVLLDEALKFDAPAIQDVLSSLPKSTKPVLKDTATHMDGLSIALGDQTFAVKCDTGKVDYADVAHEIERPGASALKDAFASHCAHMMVICHLPKADMESAVSAAIGVHVLAARLGALGKPVAALWASSMRLAAWAEFTTYAASIEASYEDGTEFPSRYWVAVQLTQDGEKIGGVTRGLKAISGYEVSMPPIAKPMEFVAGRLVGTAQYLLETGPVLHDGETVGASEMERFRIVRPEGSPELKLILEEDSGNVD